MESSLTKLVQVVSDLRDPIKGCAWDLEQTHKSLIPYVLEESHEVADAIRFGDKDNLIEELGVLLLQVLLHAQIASETKTFYLKDIVEKLTKKLIRRHPHVFNNEIANTIEDVNKIWEDAKVKENKLKSTVLLQQNLTIANLTRETKSPCHWSSELLLCFFLLYL